MPRSIKGPLSTASAYHPEIAPILIAAAREDLEGNGWGTQLRKIGNTFRKKGGRQRLGQTLKKAGNMATLIDPRFARVGAAASLIGTELQGEPRGSGLMLAGVRGSGLMLAGVRGSGVTMAGVHGEGWKQNLRKAGNTFTKKQGRVKLGQTLQKAGNVAALIDPRLARAGAAANLIGTELQGEPRGRKKNKAQVQGALSHADGDMLAGEGWKQNLRKAGNTFTKKGGRVRLGQTLQKTGNVAALIDPRFARAGAAANLIGSELQGEPRGRKNKRAQAQDRPLSGALGHADGGGMLAGEGFNLAVARRRPAKPAKKPSLLSQEIAASARRK